MNNAVFTIRCIAPNGATSDYVHGSRESALHKMFNIADDIRITYHNNLITYDGTRDNNNYSLTLTNNDF